MPSRTIALAYLSDTVLHASCVVEFVGGDGARDMREEGLISNRKRLLVFGVLDGRVQRLNSH